MMNALKRKLKSDLFFNIIIYAMGLLIVLLVLIPLLFVVAASFSDPDLVIKGKVLLLPKGITLKAYTMVFENEDIWRGFLNSCFYTVSGTFISVVLTIIAAYPLSRRKLPGRNLFMMAILFTMYFSGGMVPTYLLVRDLGMYNTIWALLIPSAISTYNLIVANTFFENCIP